MPELPEVEVTRRGIAPHLEGRKVSGVVMRRTGLRWPFPAQLPALLSGRTVQSTGRRGKYLLIHFAHGTLIIHLGMSGHLRILPAGHTAAKHDHFDLQLGSHLMRLTDPRRFGCLLWQPIGEMHPLLQKLGPEPLSDAFTGEYLFQRSRGKRVAVKSFLMDQAVVVGVGNIYASETLFMAGIRPTTPAARLSRPRVARLHAAIVQVLTRAVAQGGSSLKDFVSAEGRTGYFQLEASVYGRAGEPCRVCGTPIKSMLQGQRTTFYCPVCQKP